MSVSDMFEACVAGDLPSVRRMLDGGFDIETPLKVSQARAQRDPRGEQRLPALRPFAPFARTHDAQSGAGALLEPRQAPGSAGSRYVPAPIRSSVRAQSKATAIIIAAANDHSNIISLLMDKGADIEARDHVREARANLSYRRSLLVTTCGSQHTLRPTSPSRDAALAVPAGRRHRAHCGRPVRQGGCRPRSNRARRVHQRPRQRERVRADRFLQALPLACPESATLIVDSAAACRLGRNRRRGPLLSCTPPGAGTTASSPSFWSAERTRLSATL